MGDMPGSTTVYDGHAFNLQVPDLKRNKDKRKSSEQPTS